jgi:hypothetical protein
MDSILWAATASTISFFRDVRFSPKSQSFVKGWNTKQTSSLVTHKEPNNKVLTLGLGLKKTDCD